MIEQQNTAHKAKNSQFTTQKESIFFILMINKIK